jgi:hypothetical protein
MQALPMMTPSIVKAAFTLLAFKASMATPQVSLLILSIPLALETDSSVSKQGPHECENSHSMQQVAVACKGNPIPR